MGLPLNYMIAEYWQKVTTPSFTEGLSASMRVSTQGEDVDEEGRRGE
jgi:hypothetical protein